MKIVKLSKIKAGTLKPNQVFFYRGRKCRRLERKGIFCLAEEDKGRDDKIFSLSFHDEIDVEDRNKKMLTWKELSDDQQKAVKNHLDETDKHLARKGMKYAIDNDGNYTKEYNNPYVISEIMPMP